MSHPNTRQKIILYKLQGNDALVRQLCSSHFHVQGRTIVGGKCLSHVFTQSVYKGNRGNAHICHMQKQVKDDIDSVMRGR